MKNFLKRKLSVMIALLSVLGFAACIGTAVQAETKEAASETDTEDSDAESTAPGVFNFETHTVLLNSGCEMPIMGLGTYSLSDEECYNSVTALLEAGGRLIDTAYMYGNDVICCEL